MVTDDTQITEAEFSTGSADATVATRDIGTEGTPVQAVVAAVAEVTDSDPLELPPLYDTIDSEALNTLILQGSEPSDIEVSFRYAGCEITVHGAGEVHARRIGQSK